MSDTWGYENSDASDLGNVNEQNGPKGLRDAYAAMKKQNEELQNGLASIQNELRQQKIATVFESLGVPGAAKLYQGEPDPEKAKEWVSTMQTVFGNGNAQGSASPAVDSTQPAISDVQREQYQRMTEAGQHGVPLGNMDAAFAAVNDATDTNALIAAFQRAANMG